MDQAQRWTPDPIGAGAPSMPAWADDPAPAPEPAPRPRRYVGDPRWGILADEPGPVTPGLGVPGSPTPTVASAAPYPLPVPSPAAFGRTTSGLPGSGFAPVAASGFAPAHVFAPVRAKNPGWVIALAVLLIGGFLTSVGAAVAIPVFLNSRAQGQTTQLRTDLMTVAAAEEAVRAESGTYSADPDTVTGRLGAALTSRVSIMWADQTGFCAQAVPVGRTTPQLYVSSASGISEQPCG